MGERITFRLDGYTLEDIFNSECVLYDVYEFDSSYVESEGRNIWFSSHVYDDEFEGLVDGSESDDRIMESYVLIEMGNHLFEFRSLGADVWYKGNFDSTIDLDTSESYFTNSYANLRKLSGFIELSRY